MVRRRGLGATMVASVAFAVILVSGLAVYAASQGREGLYYAADAEDSLADEFHVLAAAEGIDVLLGIQGYLGSHALGCTAGAAALGQEVESLSQRQSYANLTVSTRAVMVAAGDAADNMTALLPYGGWVAGDLDVALYVTGTGSAWPGVSFARSETHGAHLGFALEEASAACIGAVDAIYSALGSSGLQNCTSAAAGAVIGGASGPSALAAEADGLQLGLSYRASGTSSCQVSFLVRVVQGGIAGPGGTFTASLEEGGSVSLPPPS